MRNGTPNGCLRQILKPTKLGAHHTAPNHAVQCVHSLCHSLRQLMVVPKPRLPEIPSRAPSTCLVHRRKPPNINLIRMMRRELTIRVTNFCEVDCECAVFQVNLSSQHVLSWLMLCLASRCSPYIPHSWIPICCTWLCMARQGMLSFSMVWHGSRRASYAARDYAD